MTEFEPISPAGARLAKRMEYLIKGCVKLSNYGLYLGEITLANLGNPDRIGIEVDTKRHMMKLFAVGVADKGRGWSVRRRAQASSESLQIYEMRFSNVAQLNKLPRGVYVPTGGEVYSYKEEAN